MNPYHATTATQYSEEEVFVLHDGYEADADNGYYERFLQQAFPSASNITNGKLFATVCAYENSRDHRSGEILNFRFLRQLIRTQILQYSKSCDVLFFEIGGTVGDQESELLFRVLSNLKQKHNVRMHTILASPYFSKTTEDDIELSFRSKITRQAYESLIKLGVHADSIILRTDDRDDVHKLDLEYIAASTEINKSAVFTDPHCNSIYELPEHLRMQGIHEIIAKQLGVALTDYDPKKDRLKQYVAELQRLTGMPKKLTVGIYGKTVSNDSYISLKEAVAHACVAHDIPHAIVWLDDAESLPIALSKVDCCIVGEGLHDIEQKKETIQYCKENNVPCLCISYGADVLLQHELGAVAADCLETMALTTGEVDITASNEVRKAYYKPDHKERVRSDSIIRAAASETVSRAFTILSTNTNSGDIMLMMHREHPHIVAAKYHPEYISHPTSPHPLFTQLISNPKHYAK